MTLSANFSQISVSSFFNEVASNDDDSSSVSRDDEHDFHEGWGLYVGFHDLVSCFGKVKGGLGDGKKISPVRNRSPKTSTASFTELKAREVSTLEL